MSSQDEASEWFVRLAGDDDAPLQLFVFPHAGAGCATFTDFARKLSGTFETWSVNLPGRQARFNEPSRTELLPLVADLTGDFPRRLDGRPYLIMGYCSGSLLAYLLTLELREAGFPPPSGLISVSFEPPHAVPGSLKDVLAASPDEFWAGIQSFGGVHEALVSNLAVRKVFEPAVRADFALVGDYKHVDSEPLELPITVIAGRQDPLLKPGDLAGWAAYGSDAFSLIVIPGGHWLMEDAMDAVSSALSLPFADRVPGRER